MNAQYLDIRAKHRQSLGNLASLADFSVEPGAEADAAAAVAQPNVSLYCLDDASRRAILVELPPELDLARVPFVYLAQHEQAQRLIAVPYAAFTRAAADLPPVVAPTLIYIVGRSGSTLLCSVFNELPEVRCLSEPDVATQFVGLRARDGSRDAELRTLLDATLRVLFKPAPGVPARRAMLKFRSEALNVMDLYQATFPDAVNLFMYRDAVGFVRSFYRIYRRDTDQEPTPAAEMLEALGHMHNERYADRDALLAPGQTELSRIEGLTLWWATVVDLYLKQAARGIPALAVDYHDLVERREPTLRAIFAYCGLPPERVADVMGAFDRDSQAGTPLARANPERPNQVQLSAEQLDQVQAILGRHPILGAPGFTIPGLLHL